jgi:hypothetical protein
MLERHTFDLDDPAAMSGGWGANPLELEANLIRLDEEAGHGSLPGGYVDQVALIVVKILLQKEVSTV